MNVSALLTSAGINIGMCALLLCFYSILRKQPGLVNVYFGGRFLAQENITLPDAFHFEMLLPSPSWILKAWKSTEDDILAAAGLDAVVFLRLLVFCDILPNMVSICASFFYFLSNYKVCALAVGHLEQIFLKSSCIISNIFPFNSTSYFSDHGIVKTICSIRIFSIAAVICMFLVLPLNYYGQEMVHRHIPSESLDVFTIGNVKEGSKWLWAHCLALYIITFSACILLYFEYQKIAELRLAHFTGSPANPSHFTVLVRSIPRSTEESFSDAVKNFFMNYHTSSYLAHQMIYRTGKVQRLMNNAEKIYKKLVYATPSCLYQECRPMRVRCGLCGGTSSSFNLYSNELQLAERHPGLDRLDSLKEKECAAAFVFFKTRYAAVVASQVLQSSNPMLWVTDLAPEPHDVYWSNLWLPYRQLWLRRITNLLASIVFMFLFLLPVTFVQGLSQLDKLQRMFPFLKSILNKTFVSQVVTGYLPSVILLISLYIVPPTMMIFSTVEGCTSRSARKVSTCCKVLYFIIWNVFFVNVLSGSVISQLDVISNPKEIPTLLAKAVPRQATFFMTYVLTSGWVSMCSEIMQVFAVVYSLFMRFVLRRANDPDWIMSFPYHTEVPRVLLFGLIGFTCSILAPLILPFLLVYFLLGYVVYRNQILNVYRRKYETGGQYWPIMHNTMIFSLVLMQIVAIGVFGMKESTVASGFTLILVMLTLLFNEYCRQRFRPIFNGYAAQDLIEMDRNDEQCGRMEDIHGRVLSAYCQPYVCEGEDLKPEVGETSQHLQDNLVHPTVGGFPMSSIRGAATWLSMLITLQERNATK